MASFLYYDETQSTAYRYFPTGELAVNSYFSYHFNCKNGGSVTCINGLWTEFNLNDRIHKSKDFCLYIFVGNTAVWFLSEFFVLRFKKD
jgi:hypothetical protein